MLKIAVGKSTRLAGAILSLALLTNCASPATLEGMTARRAQLAEIPRQLDNSLQVGTVLGGESTNPMWTSEVGNREFRQALEASLKNANMVAPHGEQPRYIVDAALVDVSQPMIGFSFTVTSTVQYTVRSEGSDEMIWEDTVIAPYTASVTSSFFGVKRLRLANEGSIRTNIETFIDRLSTYVRTRIISLFSPQYN